MNHENNNVWKSDSTAQDYLKGTRDAIPLATEQIRVIQKIVQKAVPKVSKILDIGCGDGILGSKLLEYYPEATLILTDLSHEMLKAAKIRMEKYHSSTKIRYIEADMSDSLWELSMKENAPYDVIVSGLAIHHLTHRRKKQIYGEIYDLLAPKGIFINLERVESKSSLGETLNAENYIDSLYDHHKNNDPSVNREEIANQYFYRPLKQSNILASVEMQTKWLEELGYKNVDIFFKIFEIAIFGGTKRPLDA